MKRRKLDFRIGKLNDDPKQVNIVYPIDSETGEEIEYVQSCNVESCVEGSKMTLTVLILPE